MAEIINIQDLPTAPNLKVSVRRPCLPEPLERLTGDEHRWRSTVGFNPTGWTPPPRVTDRVAAALPRAIEVFERSMTPAKPGEIQIALSRLSINCRIEDMSEQAWKLRFEDCIEDLSDVPSDILHDAMAKWRKTEKFWPMMSELRAIIDPMIAKRRRQIKRLKVLKNVAENPAPGDEVEFKWYLKVNRSDGQKAAAGDRSALSLGDVINDRFGASDA